MSNLKIDSGAAVVAVLHTPREKLFGVLGEINQAGVFLRGIDINSFDDWVRSIAHAEPFSGMLDLFVPMWRVERIMRDESVTGIPSLSEDFQRRTGRDLMEFLSGGPAVSAEEL